jgi:putative MATE family efflux protein
MKRIELRHEYGRGESYASLASYLYPELITVFILSSVTTCVDALFVGHLRSTSLYAALGATSILMHLIIKLADGLSVGAVVLCGYYNGLKRPLDAGRAALNACYVTLFFGGCIATALYWGAPCIYQWYGVTPKIAAYGIELLRIRTIGIFAMFIFFALIGFLRGIKNTKTPMHLFVMGAIVFTVADYVLIFGTPWTPSLGFRGSAIAFSLQYIVMAIGALVVVFSGSLRRTYQSDVAGYDRSIAQLIVLLSWPVMVDKAILALAKVWLAKLIAPLGKQALASFTVIKDIEMLAFVPALACAHVATFLASNYYGQRDWQGFTTTMRRIIIIALVCVAIILCVVCISPEPVIALFDRKGAFTRHAASALPVISIFVGLDVVQLLLSAILRGVGDVRTVMMVRVIGSVCCVLPLALLCSYLPFTPFIRFILIYGSFYMGGGVMSFLYWRRLMGESWKARLADTISHHEVVVPAVHSDGSDIQKLS